jgi:hypothetical protein
MPLGQIGKGSAGLVILMRFLPFLAIVAFTHIGKHICLMVQPAMPFRWYAAGFDLTIINDPAAVICVAVFFRFTAVLYITFVICADLFTM